MAGLSERNQALIQNLIGIFFLAGHKKDHISHEQDVPGQVMMAGDQAVQIRGVHKNQVLQPKVLVNDEGHFLFLPSLSLVWRGKLFPLYGSQKFRQALPVPGLGMGIGHSSQCLRPFNPGSADLLSAKGIEQSGLSGPGTAQEDHPQGPAAGFGPQDLGLFGNALGQIS